jgi:hypothetical protein
VQVALESEGDDTWAREVQALEAAASAHPEARPFLVTMDAGPPWRPLPGRLTCAPAVQWLLEEL